MLYIHSCGKPTKNEADAINLIKEELKIWDGLLLITNYKLEGRTKETDAILIAPGMVVCLEFKNWNSRIEIPSTSTDWHVSPPVKPPSTAVQNPVEQCKRAELALKQYLIGGTGFDPNKWYISSAVVLTNLDKTVSFIGSNEDTQRKVIFIESFLEHLDLHIQRFHPALSNRQEHVSPRDVSLVLARLGIPAEIAKEYVQSLNLSMPANQLRQSTANLNEMASYNRGSVRTHQQNNRTSGNLEQISRPNVELMLRQYTRNLIDSMHKYLISAQSQKEILEIINEGRLKFLINIKGSNSQASYEQIIDEFDKFENQIVRIKAEVASRTFSITHRSVGL